MRAVATVVAFAQEGALAVPALDATALACDVLGPGDDLFRRLKRSEPGSLLLLLAGDADAPALAAAAKAARILRKRGGGEALLVLPPAEANPGPSGRARLRRAARLTETCVVQPVGRATSADGVRCFVEPLSIFGLVGVDPVEVRRLARGGSFALLHVDQKGLEQALSFPGVREVLLTCRLRPNATLREVDEPVARLRELAPKGAHLVFAGPEVSAADEGPRSICAVLF